MAQQYYEYVNYREEHVQEQKKLPKGACHRYIVVFQSVFNCIFHVSLPPALANANPTGLTLTPPGSVLHVVSNSCRKPWF